MLIGSIRAYKVSSYANIFYFKGIIIGEKSYFTTTRHLPAGANWIKLTLTRWSKCTFVSQNWTSWLNSKAKHYHHHHGEMPAGCQRDITGQLSNNLSSDPHEARTT